MNYACFEENGDGQWKESVDQRPLNNNNTHTHKQREERKRKRKRRRRRRESRLQDKHEILKLMARARSWNVPQIPAAIPDELPLNCCQLGPLLLLLLLLRLCRISTNGITHSNKKKGWNRGQTQEETLCCHSISANNKQEEEEEEKKRRSSPGSSSSSFLLFTRVREWRNDNYSRSPLLCRPERQLWRQYSQVRHAIATRKHSSSKKTTKRKERKEKGKRSQELGGLFFFWLCLFFVHSSLTLIDPSFFIRPPCLPLQCSGSMDFDIPR